jgi:hypothetical protein
MCTGTITLSAVAALASLPASPLLPADYTSARAQSIEIGPGGVRVNPERAFRRGPDWHVSEREAVRIAQREGIVDINRVVRPTVSGASRDATVEETSRASRSTRVPATLSGYFEGAEPTELRRRRAYAREQVFSRSSFPLPRI